MDAFREVLLSPGCAVFWDDERIENTGDETIPVAVPVTGDVYLEALEDGEYSVTWIEYHP